MRVGHGIALGFLLLGGCAGDGAGPGAPDPVGDLPTWTFAEDAEPLREVGCPTAMCLRVFDLSFEMSLAIGPVANPEVEDVRPLAAGRVGRLASHRADRRAHAGDLGLADGPVEPGAD